MMNRGWNFSEMSAAGVNLADLSAKIQEQIFIIDQVMILMNTKGSAFRGRETYLRFSDALAASGSYLQAAAAYPFKHVSAHPGAACAEVFADSSEEDFSEDSEELLLSAASLESTYEEIYTYIHNLFTAVKNLKAVWSVPVAEEFQNRFQVPLEEFHKTFRQ